MTMRIDPRQIRKAAAWSRWSVGNDILYRMCRDYPNHTNEDEIIAKVWIIGRTYAAAIERRRNVEDVGDAAYETVVGPKMRRAGIDRWLAPLSKFSEPTDENCSEIIAVHSRLTDLFRDITGLEKRSLASKYLHFHFPHLFYIYDSRAANAIRKVTPRVGRLPERLVKYDEVYARFFLRCMALVRRVDDEFGIKLSSRQLDNYLLGFGRR